MRPLFNRSSVCDRALCASAELSHVGECCVFQLFTSVFRVGWGIARLTTWRVLQGVRCSIRAAMVGVDGRYLYQLREG